MGDAGGHQGAGEGTVGLPVDGYAHLLVDACQTVHILPIPDGTLHGNVLAVGQVVGNTAALVAGEATGVGDFGQKSGVGGAVAHLNGGMDAFDDPTATGNTDVDGGEAVEQGTAQTDGLGNAVFGLGIAVLPGVAVNGAGQEVGFAIVLQVLQQLDVLLNHRHTGTGLYQRPAVPLGAEQLFRENPLFGHGLVVVHSFLQVNILAGGPLWRRRANSSSGIRLF